MRPSLRPDDDKEINNTGDKEIIVREGETSVLELFKKSSKVCTKYDTVNFIFLVIDYFYGRKEEA